MINGEVVVFKFSGGKQKITSYLIATIFGVVLSALIFSNVEFVPKQGFVYLMIAIVSSISMWRMIKKAKTEFEEIIVMNSEIKFYFFNKMKDPIQLDKSNLKFEADSNQLTVKEVSSNALIGKAVRSKIENDNDWKALLATLN